MEQATTGATAFAATDWRAIVDRAVAGDRAAYARLVRLVTSFLTRWRAYDFQADWDDIVQEVLMSTVEAQRAGRLADSGALLAFVRQAARFKFIDRIRRLERRGRPVELDEGRSAAGTGETGGTALAWPPAEGGEGVAVELRLAVREALAKLDERERQAVTWVYLGGHTYEEAAVATGIPLGTLKRALRTALASLKEVLGDPRTV